MNGKRVFALGAPFVLMSPPPKKVSLKNKNCKFDPLLSSDVPDDPEKHLNAPVCVPAGSEKCILG